MRWTASDTGHDWQNIIDVVDEPLVTTSNERWVIAVVRWRRVVNVDVVILMLLVRRTDNAAGRPVYCMNWYNELLPCSCAVVTHGHLVDNSATYWPACATEWRNHTVSRDVHDVTDIFRRRIGQRGVRAVAVSSNFSSSWLTSDVISAARDLVRRFDLNLKLGPSLDRFCCRNTCGRRTGMLTWSLRALYSTHTTSYRLSKFHYLCLAKNLGRSPPNYLVSHPNRV